MKCPCGSNLEFSECCKPFLSGEALPATAEKLMRSRYTAFTQVHVDYIKKTLAPESRADFDYKETEDWAKKAIWKGLKILSTKNGGPGDKTGVVEFVATFEQDGQTLEHHEVSKFRKDSNGQWLFIDGESHTHKEGEGHHHPKPQTIVRSAPKIGRNDPCHCGSGKKYKKCCETKDAG
jgi:SEC-C motif-containing protein